MRPLPMRLMGLAAAAALVLLAHSAQVARASCGDYLMPHAATPAVPSSAQQQPPPPMPQPCHGPNCSQREQPPVLPPVLPAPVERDRQAALATLTEIPSPQFRDLPVETPVSFSRTVLSDIFHPPR